MIPAEELFPSQEVFRIDVCLSQNGAQRALGHVSGMVGDGGVAVGLMVVPNLVASGRLSIKSKTECLHSFYNPTIIKSGKSPHLRR